MNYFNSQRDGVILYLTALLFGAYDLTRHSYYFDPETSSAECGISSIYWKGVKADPVEFLGPAHIPGTPEYEEMYKVSKAVLNKVMKDRKKD